MILSSKIGPYCLLFYQSLQPYHGYTVLKKQQDKQRKCTVIIQVYTLRLLFITTLFIDFLNHFFSIGKFWTICWKYISPIFLFVIFVSAIARTNGLELQKYVYPPWSVTLGWGITCSSMACVPIYAIYLFLKTDGTFSEVN